MNIASTTSSARFNALLVEGDKGLSLEATIREQGCQVRRATMRGAAQDPLDGIDVVVISGGAEDDVLDLVGRMASKTTVIVATDHAGLGVKAARHGANIVFGASLDLAAAQIGQLMAIVELKRRRHGQPVAPSNGVVPRRSTALPLEAAPEALDALIQTAEGLVPMHRFQRVYVDYALRRFGGNKVHTAAALGIDRRTIQRWARARSDQPQANTSASTATTRDELRSS